MIITRGYALRSVDPAAYHGWDGRDGCWGTHSDMAILFRCAEHLGVPMATSGLLVDRFVTRARLRADLFAAGDDIRAAGGGHLNLWLSGHGDRIRDISGDEADGWDEAFCAYDGLFLDDEFGECLDRLPSTATFAMLVDTCHSESMHRSRPTRRRGPFRLRLKRRGPQGVIIAACRDYQSAEGYKDGGAMTLAMGKVCMTDHVRTYDQWCVAATRIVLLGGARQTPTLTWHNASADFKNSPPLLGLKRKES